jgi:deazaflavin-dependent oxidoreductase (nitroreductase family)
MIQLPSGLARFNKKVTNRVKGLWAPWLPPGAVIVHKGRKSGREYQTPVLAFRSGNRLHIILFYGERVEWLRNVLAAETAGVRRAGRTGVLTNPRVIEGSDASVPAAIRRVAGRLRVLSADFAE